jgi:hypothetical protein
MLYCKSFNNIIVKLIIYFPSKIRLLQRDFRSIAKAIVDLYPGEKEINYHEKQEWRQPCKGKLFNSYRGNRKFLVAVSLAKSQRSFKKYTVDNSK